MNKKIIGTHRDSNTTRAREKKEKSEKLKEALTTSNLREVPRQFNVRSKKIYNLLVDNLEKLSINHLSELDIFSLVEVANTMDLLNEVEKVIKRDGITQELITREGAKKIIPSPFLQQRNTLLNTLKSQLIELQLDPASRNDLMIAVSNDISNLSLDDEDLTSIVELLGEI